eukprot:12144135-Alexandrium_andersonii.AAC.1
MLWKNWVAVNVLDTYRKTLLLPWDRWNEVIIDRCPPAEVGPRFQQLRVAMTCLQSLQEDIAAAVQNGDRYGDLVHLLKADPEDVEAKRKDLDLQDGLGSDSEE